MPAFAWRERATETFGIVHYPAVQVSLRSANGRFHKVAMVFDSGATVSLLPRSMADLLGLRFKEAPTFTMTGVGGAVNTLRLFQIDTIFDEHWPPIRTRFAIAESDAVPKLLGRLDVFDRFQILFDPRFRETTLRQPNH